MFSTACTSEQSGCLGKLLSSWELAACFLNSLKIWDVICASCAELVGQSQEAANWDIMFLSKLGEFLAMNWCNK